MTHWKKSPDKIWDKSLSIQDDQSQCSQTSDATETDFNEKSLLLFRCSFTFDRRVKKDLILIHFISSVIELRFEMMFAFFFLCTRSQESNFKMRLSDNSPCFQSSPADDVVNSFRYNNKNKSRRCWFSSPPHRRDRRPAPMSARFVAKVPKGSKDEWRESLSEGKMQNNGREAT